jgi:hypothetical protein
VNAAYVATQLNVSYTTDTANNFPTTGIPVGSLVTFGAFPTTNIYSINVSSFANTVMPLNGGNVSVTIGSTTYLYGNTVTSSTSNLIIKTPLTYPVNTYYVTANSAVVAGGIQVANIASSYVTGSLNIQYGTDSSNNFPKTFPSSLVVGSNVALSLTMSNTQIYVNPYASVQHRPYDGGVLLSTLAPVHGSSVIRQSKKCFRYQSGKGILFSSGTLFSPNLDIASIGITGITATLTSNANAITYPGTVPNPVKVNVSSGVFTSGQVVASFLGQNLGTVTITSTQTVSSNAQVSLSYSGSFPSLGIPTGTVVTTCPPGSNLQIVTDIPHGIPTSGARVSVRNVGSSNLNGTNYLVTSSLDSRTINIASQSTITSIPVFLGDQPRLVVTNWHGSCVRAGIFEDPNGMFWEYDGQNLFVVRRQSTYMCAGSAWSAPQSQVLTGVLSGTTGSCTLLTTQSINPGDTTALLNVVGGHTVTINMYTTISGLGTVWVIGAPDYFQVQVGFIPAGANPPSFSGTLNFVLPTTRFQDQLRVCERFTLRGMTHEITSILGQGVLTFNPPYRGTTTIDINTGVKICKIKELRIPQSNFNRDTMDGTGPSGYKVDLSRMQMIGIQYTWYGAGFIDFMMRGPEGNWLYAHRIKNNNVNDEAFMRSGNLPVRYELTVETRAAISALATNIGSADTSITIVDPGTYFPSSNGTLLIDNEMISYSSLTGSTFTGLTRAAPLNYVVNDLPRTFTGQANTSHLAGTSVNLISCTATPTLTHWGSSFITDGQFDNERGYYFNYSNTSMVLNTSNNLTSNTSSAVAFAVRLGPTVANGFTGDIGTKELLNRSQLLLQKLEVTSNVNVQTIGYLNPTGVTFNTSQWQPINSSFNGSQPSLVQYYAGVTGTPQPGERVFQSIVQGNNQNNLDLTNLKEMSNSILSGNQMFPDGPDVLLIQVTNLSTTSPASIQVNLFWSEAQA